MEMVENVIKLIGITAKYIKAMAKKGVKDRRVSANGERVVLQTLRVTQSDSIRFKHPSAR
jgi:hypothetical protein